MLDDAIEHKFTNIAQLEKCLSLLSSNAKEYNGSESQMFYMVWLILVYSIFNLKILNSLQKKSNKICLT